MREARRQHQRIRREVSLLEHVRKIHLPIFGIKRDVGCVLQERREIHDIVPVRTRRLQRMLDVEKHLLALRFEIITADRLAVLVKRRHAGDIDKARRPIHAQRARKLPRGYLPAEIADEAVKAGIVNPAEAKLLKEALAARLEAIEVDEFKPEQYFAEVDTAGRLVHGEMPLKRVVNA